jgi:hypothetical protein
MDLPDKVELAVAVAVVQEIHKAIATLDLQQLKVVLVEPEALELL